jgi:AcrR family transcriptional regulator
VDAREDGSAGGDNRGLIVAAARAQLAQSGYEAMSMRSVAREVGFDPRLVHYYFAGKQDLATEALESARVRLTAPDRGHPTTPGQHVVRRARLSWRRFREEWRAVVSCAVGPDLAATGLLGDALQSLIGHARPPDDPGVGAPLAAEPAPAAADPLPPGVACTLVCAALLGTWLVQEGTEFAGQPPLPPGYDAALAQGLDRLLAPGVP